MNTVEKNLNIVFVYALSCILLGGFFIQFALHEEPCPLCLLQRLGMLGMASGALMNLKFGVRTSHYALSLLAAIFGGFVALRHIFLHVCPGFSTFGTPVWGLSLYTWSFIAHASSVAYIALLLLIFDKREREKNPSPLSVGGYIAFVAVFALALLNALATFWKCAWGPCLG